jgi:hypothetical protein
MVAVEHILRYVRRTIAYGLRYTSSEGVMLHGFTDSDWMGSVVDRKSTSGYCFSLDSAMISWTSRKQGSVDQSTAEAEYIAASAASREAVWLRKLLSDLFRTELEPTVIHCDNQSCIKLTENPVFHDRSKHIEISLYPGYDSKESSQLTVCSDSRTDSRHLHQATALDKVCILS